MKIIGPAVSVNFAARLPQFIRGLPRRANLSPRERMRPSASSKQEGDLAFDWNVKQEGVEANANANANANR
jgi:hypothetical protein